MTIVPPGTLGSVRLQSSWWTPTGIISRTVIVMPKDVPAAKAYLAAWVKESAQ